MDRYFEHRFNPRLLTHVDTASIVATLRVLVDPDLIVGIDHHVAFVIDDAECGLHVRNCVAVPTNGWGATSMVRTTREVLLGVLSGRTPWSAAVADGSLVVTGDVALVDRIRAAFELDGLRR
ncbi:MAG: alkyl sulfatase C-terminal domain-containing protein [Actinomycetota bacterium]